MKTKQKIDKIKLGIIFFRHTGQPDTMRAEQYDTPMVYWNCRDVERCRTLMLQRYVGKVKYAAAYSKQNGKKVWDYSPEWGERRFV